MFHSSDLLCTKNIGETCKTSFKSSDALKNKLTEDSAPLNVKLYSPYFHSLSSYFLLLSSKIFLNLWRSFILLKASALGVVLEIRGPSIFWLLLFIFCHIRYMI